MSLIMTSMLLMMLMMTAELASSSAITGLRATGLGCRPADAADRTCGSATTDRTVRTCFTAHRSTVGLRALQSRASAAATCRRLHDGWLASIPNKATQNWLEQALNSAYVSQQPQQRTALLLRLVGDFWIGAQLVGIARRQWAWSGDDSISGWLVCSSESDVGLQMVIMSRCGRVPVDIAARSLLSV